MVRSLIKCLLVGSISLSAAYALDDQNNLNLQRPNKLNQVVGTPDSIKSFKSDTTDDLMAKRKALNNKVDEVDTSKFTKVKLIDAVLETLAHSDLLKSSREKVIQYEIKVKDAMAEFYPTLNYEYNWGRTRAKPGSDENLKFKYFNDQSYKFVLRQNLYSGGGSVDNLDSVIKRLDVSKNQYRIVLDEEIKKAVKAYFDVVFANRSVLVNERNMKKLQKILEIVTIKYDNGAASIGDLTSIKANVANAMTKLVKVKSKFIEALRYYEYIVGVEFKNTIPYEKNFDVNIGEFEELYKRAEAKNRDLVNYYETIEVEKYNKKRAESEFKPKVDFELSYERVVDGEDFEEQEAELNGKVRLSYNLFNGGKDKNGVLEKNSKIRDLQYRLAEEKKKLRWNLSKLHTSMNSVSDALKSTIEEIKASRLMVSSYWDAFKLGEQDLNTLLQGQRQLNTAETELVKFEKSHMSDFFNILELTGDLSSFFDVDPENPKFIDFSKSDYKKTIIAKDGQELILADKKVKKEEVKEPEPKEIALPQASIDENIKKFIEKFKNFDDDSYMIEISSFNTTYDSIEFISENSISENSFYYDVINGLDIQTKIAHNNFETIKEAKEYLSELKKKDLNKSYEIKQVKDIKTLYDNYLNGLKLKPQKEKIKIKTKIKVVEKVRQEIKKEEFFPNEEFKNQFLNSDGSKFTINVSTFASNNEIKEFVLENELYENSFFFKYGDNQLFKLVNGIYDNYNQALNEINILSSKNSDVFPVIQRVELIKRQYLENIELNEKEEITPEYEYIDISKKDKNKYPLKSKNSIKKVKEEELKLQKLEEERIAKEKVEAEAKRLAEEKAKEEELRLQKLEEERIAKEKAEARRVAQEQALKLEQEKIAQDKKRKELAQEQARKHKAELAKKEALEKAKEEEQRLRLQRIENERIAKEKAKEVARELAEKIAKDEAEKLRLRRVQEQKLQEEIAKAEALRLAEQKAQKEAEELKQKQEVEARRIAQEQALKLEQEKIAQEKKRKELAQEQARKHKVELAKKEALEKAKEEEERLRLQEIEDERIAQEKSQKEALRLAEELKKKKLEQELIAKQKAKEEAYALKLTEQKAQKEAEELKQKQEAEAKRVAQEQALKLEQERLLVEEKRKEIAREQARKLEEELERKEKRELAKEQSLKVKSEIESVKQKELNSQETYKKHNAIEEIDFAQDKDTKKRVEIPYKKRLEIFKEKFYKAPKGKYTLKLTTIESDKVRWYAHRFGLDPNYVVVVKKEQKSDIFYGIFDSVIEAKKKTETLHPLIYESKPPVKKIGSVR